MKVPHNLVDWLMRSWYLSHLIHQKNMNRQCDCESYTIFQAISRAFPAACCLLSLTVAVDVKARWPDLTTTWVMTLN